MHRRRAALSAKEEASQSRFRALRSDDHAGDVDDASMSTVRAAAAVSADAASASAPPVIAAAAASVDAADTLSSAAADAAASVAAASSSSSSSASDPAAASAVAAADAISLLQPMERRGSSAPEDRPPPSRLALTTYMYYRDMEADKLATLEEWFGRHIAHPYPKGNELAELARTAGLTAEQVILWMRKKRAREKYESRSLQDEKSRASIAAALARRMSTQAERVDEHVVSLRRWIDEHAAHPYPTAAELHELCAATLLNGDEVLSWLDEERRWRRREQRIHSSNEGDGNATATWVVYRAFSAEQQAVLRDWFERNIAHPYPDESDVKMLVERTKLTPKQVLAWTRDTRSSLRRRQPQVSSGHRAEIPAPGVPSSYAGASFVAAAAAAAAATASEHLLADASLVVPTVAASGLGASGESTDLPVPAGAASVDLAGSGDAAQSAAAQSAVSATVATGDERSTGVASVASAPTDAHDDVGAQAEMRGHVDSAIEHWKARTATFVSPEQRAVLQHWFQEHLADPYPTDSDVAVLSAATNLQPTKVRQWIRSKREWIVQQIRSQTGSATADQVPWSSQRALSTNELAALTLAHRHAGAVEADLAALDAARATKRVHVFGAPSPTAAASSAEYVGAAVEGDAGAASSAGAGEYAVAGSGPETTLLQ